MATTIKLKNGSGAPLAGDLVQGEPALDLTNKRLYTEDSGGTVIEIGTSPSTIDINAGTIDGTVIGGSSAAAGTFTTFTSTGIDDNATSTAITIDSSENVGIGTTSPTHDLTVGSTGAADYVIALRGGVGGFLGWDDSANTTILQAPNTRSLSFQVNSDTFSAGTEAMRIDSSGNLLVGKTSNDNTTNGFVLDANGTLNVVRSSEYLMRLNRTTTDGEILRFQKDGTTVGSIYSYNGFLGIGSPSGNDAYLLLGSDFVAPATSTGTARDGAIDLGSTGRRFKDLHLSGGAYLGGTGSANYLDDYEEGDHTCTVTMGSGSCSLYSNYDKIKYTKIGNLVTIQGQIRVESVSSPSGEMRVSMPFSINTTDDEGSNVSGSLIRTYLGNAPTGGLFLHGTMVFNQGNQCVVQWSKSGSATVNHVPIAGEYLVFNFSYRAA
jgi:hypothetical protein